jgi:hypothetical protein
MKPVITVYCESNDIKLAVVSKDSASGKPAVLKTASVSLFKSSTDLGADGGFRMEEESLDIEGIDESASIKGA